MVKNGTYTLVLTSHGWEWQFHIATDIKWSRMAISHCYWHQVVKNGNFTFLLTSRGQEWQLADLLKICQQIYPPQMHQGIYIMGGIWQPFCILQEKVGISCYVSIIRVVNSKLAWYSHVRCNPLNTPNTPKTPTTWQLQISTMRTHICQV